jgi:RNA polymerase sigma-70 factor (ECF subfamily)
MTFQHGATSRTTTSLLEGLHDAGNTAAWCEFDRRYRGLLMNFALKLGLDEADAADVAQDTLTRFLISYRAGQYDRTRGRLRSWLAGIARGRIASLRERRAAQRIRRGESALIDLPDDVQCAQIWESGRRQAVLLDALGSLRQTSRIGDRTVLAFELVCLRGISAAAAAEHLDMSVHDVYLAKSRVAGRLRRIIARLEAAYEDLPP